MSDSSHDSHTGPIKTPTQLLWTAIGSFVVPIFLIIGLVYYVTSGIMPAGSTNADSLALGGVSQSRAEEAIAARIQKVGTVEIRDANREPRSGEEVFKAQCTTCHTAGALGAPKFGDAGAWGPRIAKGFDALVQSALKGKGNMPSQAGGDFSDLEIARGVAYMADAGGAKFPVPANPAAGASAPAAAASTPVAAAK